MFEKLFAALVAASFLALSSAECPNACSAHGKCGAYDMCICYRNWMSNDCSERICQFGMAHVDTPKGDLDASGGALSSPSTTVIKNDARWPYGTTEQYPNMVDSLDTVLTNTAHAYFECSNKGICDRQSGTCACFDGYSGSACQRASCPSSSSGTCSGHGTCETIKSLAASDFDNIYRLWDQEVTMGCKCDGGYTGPDCSQKICKYGADPLYYDDYANIRYSNFTYQIYTTVASTLTGNYSLWFQDRTGEDWQTGAISIDADCTAITLALESIPNDVIPSGSVLCYQHPAQTSLNVPIYNAAILIGGSTTGTTKFTLAFPSNPGSLKQIAINKYLDGTRPTLYSSETTSTLAWHIYANGYTGEDTDMVPDYCEGVTVTLRNSGYTNTHVLDGLTTATTKLLKTCLGDSNGDASDNVEVYNWDYGGLTTTVAQVLNSQNISTMTFPNPHLIKLIDATQDSVTFTDEVDPALYAYPKTQLCASVYDRINGYTSSGAAYPNNWCSNRDPPGFYAVVFYDSTNQAFNILTRASADFATTTTFYVYTTTGYLQRVSPIVSAVSYTTVDAGTPERIIAKTHSNIMYLHNTSSFSYYAGAVDCETNPVGTGYFAADCLNKDDYVMFLNNQITTAGLAANPVYPNLHRVKKIQKGSVDSLYTSNQDLRHQIILDYGTNALYTTEVPAAIYKFHPPTGFNYVGECSNRGICDTNTGLCNCFAGYTSDNCGVQDALAA